MPQHAQAMAGASGCAEVRGRVAVTPICAFLVAFVAVRQVDEAHLGMALQACRQGCDVATTAVASTLSR